MTCASKKQLMNAQVYHTPVCSKREILWLPTHEVRTYHIHRLNRFVCHIVYMYMYIIYMCRMFDQINIIWYPQQCGSAMTKMKNNRSRKCTEWTEGVVLCNSKSERCCEVISASMGCVGCRLSQKPAWCDGHTLTLTWLLATICVRATARSRSFKLRKNWSTNLDQLQTEQRMRV